MIAEVDRFKNKKVLGVRYFRRSVKAHECIVRSNYLDCVDGKYNNGPETEIISSTVRLTALSSEWKSLQGQASSRTAGTGQAGHCH